MSVARRTSSPRPRADVASVRTASLDGEPPVAEDLDFLAELLGDERVGRTLGGALDRERSALSLEAELARWAAEGFGYWVWRERATGEPVARGGLHRATVEGEQMFEVGWAVLPSRWGRGYATELGRASIEAAGRLELSPVVAYTLPGNAASRRVMEKLGMTYDRTFVHGPWGPHVLYVASGADADPARRDG